jgi:hypothetical protein
MPAGPAKKVTDPTSTLGIRTDLPLLHRALSASYSQPTKPAGDEAPSPDDDISAFPSPSEGVDEEVDVDLNSPEMEDHDNMNALSPKSNRSDSFSAGNGPPSAHPSMMAVHGSAMPSPALGMGDGDLKDGEYFHFPLPKGRRQSQAQGLLNAQTRDALLTTNIDTNININTDVEVAKHDPERLESVSQRPHGEVAKTEKDIGEMLERRDGNQAMEEAATSSDAMGDGEQDQENLNKRVIAIDFDDVCCQNIVALCEEHNAKWGTNITQYVTWPLARRD